MASYLDGNGLLYFWQKIKNTFTVKADAIKNITRSGTTFTATRADGTTFTFTQQDNNTTYSDATASTHGLMSTADKAKLDGIASGAEVNQNAFGKVAGLEHSSGSVVTTMEADEDCDTLYISYALNASQNSYTHITQEYDSTLGIGNGVITTPINSHTLSNPVFGQGYGECTTANGTAAKTAAMNKYVRVNGGIVSIKFTADVDANATLNINDCGAVPIKFKGAAITAGVIKAGDIATFILNGSGVSPSYELISKTVAAATGSADGLMSAADKTKLAGIAAGAEVNQNAFSNVKVGSTTVAADAKTDTLELVAGSNVTLTPDATNDKVTIAAANTTYSDATTSAHGLMTAADKTKLDGIETGARKIWYALTSTEASAEEKSITCDGFTYTDGAILIVKFINGNTHTNMKFNINSTGAVTVASNEISSSEKTGGLQGQSCHLYKYNQSLDYWNEINGFKLKEIALGVRESVAVSHTDARQYAVTPDKNGNLSVNVPWSNTTYSDVTTSAHGLMTAADKTKLNGIAAGAEVNQNAFSNIAVGSTTIYADGKTDTLTLVAGSNVTLTPDATNDKVTIAATDTTYTAASSTPLMDGTGIVGTSAKYAREDHVHPSDTSRVPTTRTVNGKALSSNITLSASDVSAISSNDTHYARGSANGICPLNSSGKIDAAYLPSYVDDVIEAYPRSGQTELSGAWLSLTSGGSALAHETGKIYVLMEASTNYPVNSQFRWGGSAYVLLQSGEGVSAITNAEIDTIVAS